MINGARLSRENKTMKKLIIPIINFWGKRIEKRRFSKSPIYIGGCGRSGTTLLLSILSAHNDIFACPKELHLFENATCDDDVVKTPKYYRLYRTLISQKIKRTALRYCEKAPVNVYKVELIDKFHHGNFKLIHIIRDGRDVILSKHPSKKDEYWVSPERWINDVSKGLSYLNHPNVLTIRYEELVNKYEKTIKDICIFLEIPASDELLHWHQHTTVRKNNALFSPISDIHNSSVNKWEKSENTQRAAALTSIPEGKSLLKRLNYLSDS